MKNLPGLPLLNIYNNLSSEPDRDQFLHVMGRENQEVFLQELRQQLNAATVSDLVLQEQGDKSLTIALAVIGDPQLLTLCTPSTLCSWGITYKEVALQLIQTHYTTNTCTLQSWGLQHEAAATLLIQSCTLPNLTLFKLGQKWPSVHKLILATPSLYQTLNARQYESLAQTAPSSLSFRKPI
jgi:hypothetical protein